EKEVPMNRRNIETHQMLTRVAEFASDNIGLFPKNSAAGEIVGALQSGVGGLSQKGSARVSAETAMRASKKFRAASREKLLGYLRRADQIARALQNDQLQLPQKRTEQALIASGRAFVEDVGSLSQDFAKHGVSPKDVSEAVDALEGTIRDYSNAKAA